MKAETLSHLFRAYDVVRFHTTPHLRSQTVGDHTARVLVMAIYLSDGDISVNLCRAILEHDGYEHLTGDIPATAKWIGNFGDIVDQIEAKMESEMKIGYSAYSKLLEEEKILLKVADMAELCTRASAEVLMGNKFMNPIFQNGISFLESIKPQIPMVVWERLETLLGPPRQKLVVPTGTAH